MDTILCVSLSMPVASATAEMSFSVLRRLKTCVSSTMKNDRLSSLGLMHIHRDVEVDLYKATDVFHLLRHEGQIFDNFKIFLSIKVIKIVLDSILYETLKWPQIAPFCISSKVIMACTLLSLSYVPASVSKFDKSTLGHYHTLTKLVNDK